MSVEIAVELALVSARAPLVALADVHLRWSDSSITIRRCAVFEKDREPAWASLPRLPVEKNGKKTYVPLIDLQRDLKRRVLEAVLTEYRKEMEAC